MRRPLTVVIPTYNEEKVLGETLRFLSDRCTHEPQVIVVDGGSSDGTGRVAHEHHVSFAHVEGGRGAQMEFGASMAPSDGDLLFLHADTHVPPNYDRHLSDTLRTPRTVAGAFKLSIRDAGLGLRCVQYFANLRARFLQRPYGDQALFLRKTTLDSIGGYPTQKFLDDYELVLRLKRSGIGRIRIAAGAPVSTDGRRWNKLGVVRTTLMNQAVIFGYHIGVPIARLSAWYRGALRRA